ncbi:hypothetical protein B484DRAFT_444976 [Ochromonadaceae sp. CCMP2298]|nr:hypothetical protein B484DRAFT_444976 [Ochromonadaceae sp. CCMP2298]|mmetsp:Transcript_21790/g.48485  ORF Transcript_21790/g.48485 Transcript_21790/m.48485 type:complete len:363 (-) Transcript_21790:191-1279(-)
MKSADGNSVFNNAVGSAILQATDPSLEQPDWTHIIGVCDVLNSDESAPHQAKKALIQRMRDPHQNTVYLTMSLAEACVSNCVDNFLEHAHSKAFLEEFVAVARGSKGDRNATEALRVIQLWARISETQFPLFCETYRDLRGAGLYQEEPGGGGGGGAEGADMGQKLTADLAVVLSRAAQLQEMLNSGLRIDSTQVSECVGFLEACRDRMGGAQGLVMAGAEGRLSEQHFSDCLAANDAVLRALEAEAATATSSNSTKEVDLLGMDPPSPHAVEADMGMGGGLLDMAYLPAPTAHAAPAPAQIFAIPPPAPAPAPPVFIPKLAPPPGYTPAPAPIPAPGPAAAPAAAGDDEDLDSFLKSLSTA